MDNNHKDLRILIQSSRNFLGYFLKWWWIIGLAVILGGILGVLYATYQKSVYQSRLTFALEENTGGLNGALGLAAQFGINIGGGGKDIFAGENIIAILNSRRIIEDVLLSADTINRNPVTLAQKYLEITNISKIFTNHKRLGTINFPAGVTREKFTYHQDSVLYILYKSIIENDLKVEKPDRKFNLYSIEFISKNEWFSKIFIERLLSSAIDFYTDLRTIRSRKTISILEKQLATLKGNTIGAISKRADIQDANINPVFADQPAKMQKFNLDVTAYGGAYSEVFKNLELAKYQYLQDIPLLQIIDAPNYPMENLKKGKKMTGIYGGVILGLLTIMALYFQKVYKSIMNTKEKSLSIEKE